MKDFIKRAVSASYDDFSAAGASEPGLVGSKVHPQWPSHPVLAPMPMRTSTALGAGGISLETGASVGGGGLGTATPMEVAQAK